MNIFIVEDSEKVCSNLRRIQSDSHNANFPIQIIFRQPPVIHVGSRSFPEMGSPAP
jgi:hypothetical protein